MKLGKVIIGVMFIGHYSSICTTKNQITFPSKFRELTGKKILITSWLEKSLVVLPFEDGEKILTKFLEEAPALLPEIRDLERFLYGNAVQVELDEQNRFVLPKQLREHASIGKRAVFVGVKERIELWDENMWSNYGKIREAQIKQTIRALYEEITLQKRRT